MARGALQVEGAAQVAHRVVQAPVAGAVAGAVGQRAGQPLLRVRVLRLHLEGVGVVLDGLVPLAGGEVVRAQQHVAERLLGSHLHHAPVHLDGALRSGRRGG